LSGTDVKMHQTSHNFAENCSCASLYRLDFSSFSLFLSPAFEVLFVVSKLGVAFFRNKVLYSSCCFKGRIIGSELPPRIVRTKCRGGHKKHMLLESQTSNIPFFVSDEGFM
jgi:hypothetical protein